MFEIFDTSYFDHISDTKFKIFVSRIERCPKLTSQLICEKICISLLEQFLRTVLRTCISDHKCQTYCYILSKKLIKKLIKKLKLAVVKSKVFHPDSYLKNNPSFLIIFKSTWCYFFCSSFDPKLSKAPGKLCVFAVSFLSDLSTHIWKLQTVGNNAKICQQKAIVKKKHIK